MSATHWRPVSDSPVWLRLVTLSLGSQHPSLWDNGHSRQYTLGNTDSAGCVGDLSSVSGLSACRLQETLLCSTGV